MDGRDIAIEILRRGRRLSIATVSAEGRPWIANCWYAHSDFELLFMSKDFRRHSRDIMATSLVAATVVGLENTLGDEVQSVTIEGICASVGPKRIHEARELMVTRFPRIKFTEDQFVDPEVPDCLWQIAPTGVVVFDEFYHGAPDEPRLEVM